MKGIDVSKWQGEINWLQVKASGVEFVIIKAGGSDAGFYEDPKFDVNYAGAHAAGIPIGVYYFVGSRCTSYEDGVADAKRCLNILQGRKLDLPVFIDVETTSPQDKEGATWAVVGFCETVRSAGYRAGVYGSDIAGFKDRLDVSKLSGIDKWVAKYSSEEPTYVKDWKIWQHSDRGNVAGISGNVDLDEASAAYITEKPSTTAGTIRQSYGTDNMKTELINGLLDIQNMAKELIEKCQML